MPVPQKHQIAENTFYVGSRDWNVRSFHGYETRYGTSYNAYVINGPNPTVIDTVKAPFAEEFIENIQKVVPLEDLKYVVSLHSEPDHSGSLPHLLRAAPHVTLYCSRLGKKALESLYPKDFPNWKVEAYKDKDTLDLGDGHVLTFRLTQLLHWPDSSVAQDTKTGVLFSSDAFGQHRATTAVVDDEPSAPEWSIIAHDSRLYWANILMLYGQQARKALETVKSLPVPPTLIACAHGLLTRKYMAQHIELYQRWSNHVCPTPMVAIVYDSMYGCTEKMAKTIEEGVMLAGAEANVINCRITHITDVADYVLDAPVLVVGSSNLNNNILPPVAQALTYLKGLGGKNNWSRVGGVFGSYGWQSHVNTLTDIVTESGVDIVVEPVICNYTYTDDVLDKCREMGKELAQHAISRVEADREKLESFRV
ncbi:hypothetical protein RCL1_002062 [Eukaryota sp. TZLM3-RCL]